MSSTSSITTTVTTFRNSHSFLEYLKQYATGYYKRQVQKGPSGVQEHYSQLMDQLHKKTNLFIEYPYTNEKGFRDIARNYLIIPHDQKETVIRSIENLVGRLTFQISERFVWYETDGAMRSQRVYPIFLDFDEIPHVKEVDGRWVYANHWEDIIGPGLPQQTMTYPIDDISNQELYGTVKYSVSLLNRLLIQECKEEFHCEPEYIKWFSAYDPAIGYGCTKKNKIWKVHCHIGLNVNYHSHRMFVEKLVSKGFPIDTQANQQLRIPCSPKLVLQEDGDYEPERTLYPFNIGNEVSRPFNGDPEDPEEVRDYHKKLVKNQLKYGLSLFDYPCSTNVHQTTANIMSIYQDAFAYHGMEDISSRIFENMFPDSFIDSPDISFELSIFQYILECDYEVEDRMLAAIGYFNHFHATDPFTNTVYMREYSSKVKSMYVTKSMLNNSHYINQPIFKTFEDDPTYCYKASFYSLAKASQLLNKYNERFKAQKLIQGQRDCSYDEFMEAISILKPYFFHVACLLRGHKHLIMFFHSWVAHIFQCPDDTQNPGLLLIGDAAIGKGRLLDFLTEALGIGNFYRYNEWSYFQSEFNGEVEGLKLAWCDEVGLLPNNLFNQMKSLICGSNVQSSMRKGENRKLVRCTARVIATSNDRGKLLPNEKPGGERRWNVIELIKKEDLLEQVQRFIISYYGQNDTDVQESQNEMMEFEEIESQLEEVVENGKDEVEDDEVVEDRPLSPQLGLYERIRMKKKAKTKESEVEQTTTHYKCFNPPEGSFEWSDGIEGVELIDIDDAYDLQTYFARIFTPFIESPKVKQALVTYASNCDIEHFFYTKNNVIPTCVGHDQKIAFADAPKKQRLFNKMREGKSFADSNKSFDQLKFFNRHDLDTIKARGDRNEDLYTFVETYVFPTFCTGKMYKFFKREKRYVEQPLEFDAETRWKNFEKGRIWLEFKPLKECIDLVREENNCMKEEDYEDFGLKSPIEAVEKFWFPGYSPRTEKREKFKPGLRFTPGSESFINSLKRFKDDVGFKRIATRKQIGTKKRRGDGELTFVNENIFE